MLHPAPRCRLTGPPRALRRPWRCRAFAVLIGGLVVVAGRAQLPIGIRERSTGYVALQQAVRDAATDTRVLLIASHPDDQYVLPAAYLRFKLGFRVAALLFTRGEGGQNSQGPETGDALGRIRTLEAERSAAHLGIDMFYLNRPDNGFSRTAKETLDQWGKRSTAHDLARLIRRIQPDLIITTHHPEEKHGHDLALLEVLPRAVELAADPDFDQDSGRPAFQVARLFRGATTAEEDQITESLPMDQIDSARGKTYRELAYRALEEHRSQYPLREMDTVFASFLELIPVCIDDQPFETSLEDSLPNVFRVLHTATAPGASPLQSEDFAKLRRNLSARHDLSTAAIAVQKKLRSIRAPTGSELARRLARRMEAVERVILGSAGVHVFMKWPLGVEAAPGDEFPLQIWVGNAGRHRVTDIEVAAVDGGTLRLVGPRVIKKTLESEESLALEARYLPPALAADDYRRIFSRHTFVWPLRVRFKLAVDDQPITIEREIWTGLHPAVKLTVMPPTLLLPRGESTVRFVVNVERKTSRPLDLKLRLNPPAGMAIVRPVRQVKLIANERFREFTFTLRAPNVRPGVSTMHVRVGSSRIRVNVHKVDVKVRDDLRVGLVPGVDDTSYEVLQALIGEKGLEKFERGRPLPILDRRALDTIVVDIRALRSRFARAGFARLLDFVKEGGRLVVFYHKDKEFNLDTANFRGAPYPLEIGKGRVTRQDAPVNILAKGHVLLNFPNVIRPEDWDGWKQERGLYFPAVYDPEKFQELLEMHDEDFPAERGSLLYARYGAGEYIYCALSLYRQLKNRHAGACRIFANLISPKR